MAIEVAISMKSAIRLVRRIQIAMLAGIALYLLTGEKLAPRVSGYPAITLLHALSLVSISLVGATVVVRRTLILPSETLLKGRPDDRIAVTRWRTGYLFMYALCEMLGLFGLILRMSGFTLSNVWGFYLGGFLLLLLYSPRTPRDPSIA
jgi:hypothetical protein